MAHGLPADEDEPRGLGPLRIVRNTSFQPPESRPKWAKNSLWAPAAAMAVVSVKNLFEQQNYHHPLRLLIWQQVLALLVMLLQHIKTQRLSIRPFLQFSEFIGELLRYPRTQLVHTAVMLNVSSLLYIQAILHVPNLVTLLMLTTLTNPVESLAVSTLKTRNVQKDAAARMTFALLAGGVILYDEYRLTVTGLTLGFLSLICVKIKRASDEHRNARKVPSIQGSLYVSDGKALAFSIFLSLPFLAVCSMILEPSDVTSRPADSVFYPTLILNAITSAIVLVLGASLDMPPEEPSGFPDAVKRDWPSIWRLSLDFAKSGAVAWLSTIVCHRGYTTWVQAIAYFLGFFGLASQRILEAFTKNNSKISSPVNDEKIISTRQTSRTYLGLTRRDSSAMYQLPQTPADTWQEAPRRANGALAGHGVPRRDPKAGTQVYRISIALIIMGLISWVSYMRANFQTLPGKVAGLPRPSLDTEYQALFNFDIVISMHRESLASVSSVITRINELDAIATSPRIFVYTKDEHADTSQLQRDLNAFDVIQVPNVGRESETYLRHIVANWDTLADHTLFIQADIHNPREFYARIQDYFQPNTGMLSLGFSGNTCDCKNCGDRWGWSDRSGVLLDIYEKANRKSCGPMLLSYKGQFLASARRIRGVNREVYEDLHHALVDPHSWAHQPKYLKGRPDSLNAPYFGYTMERLWSTLLQCSDLDVAWKCPTLLSGTRRGGGPGDCQCFD